MNPLIRWNQLNELEDLRHTLRSLFSRARVNGPEEHASLPQWVPLVAITENARGYVLKVELPQVKQEDVKITLEHGTLSITCERKFDQNSNKHHRVQHAYGCFAHTFLLPQDAHPAKVSAVFKKGVLIVHLAKNQNARPRQIEAEAATHDQIPSHRFCSLGWGINE